MFVANPKKPPQIETILRRNKDKLLKFLKDFHNDKEGSISSLASRRRWALTRFLGDTRRAIYGEFVHSASCHIV